MYYFKIVDKLGGGQKGHHHFVAIPRAGDYVVLGDTDVWRVSAVALYGFSTGQSQGAVGELLLAQEKPQGSGMPLGVGTIDNNG